MGIDRLPYEVFKKDIYVRFLTHFFQMCFSNCVIPGMWRKSIISPIPKSSSSDIRVPLNYRGISLLSNIYKLFSGVLNNRLVSLLETFNLSADEQNGFRKGRACIDQALFWAVWRSGLGRLSHDRKVPSSNPGHDCHMVVSLSKTLYQHCFSSPSCKWVPG